MLLRARRLPTGVGQRPIDVSASGVDADVPARTKLPLGGALRPIPTTAEPDGDGDAGTPSTPEPASPWPNETVHDQFRAALAGILNAPDAMPADEPLLTPPRYGATQSGRGALDAAQRERWYEQLNLEPEARVAAQYGTRLVQEQQEALVASAWEQAAELRDVNTVLRNASFGVTVASSLHRRHLSRMSPEALLLALAPAQRQAVAQCRRQGSRHRLRRAAERRAGAGRRLQHGDAPDRPATGRDLPPRRPECGPRRLARLAGDRPIRVTPQRRRNHRRCTSARC